jgi:isoleucyl-tRNA synthetase
MSKRLGNVVDPWQAVGEHGADAVRWYLVASAAPWLPKLFDPSGLAHVRHGLFTTLAHSYGFLAEYARLDGFDPRDARVPPVRERSEIDRWLVSRTHSLAAVVRARFDALDVAGAARAIEAFVVEDVSRWYIRRNRRRFWKGEIGADKLAAFATLHGALRTAALAMAPLAPFLAELLWKRLEPAQGSVHLQRLPEPDSHERVEELERSMEVVQRVVVMGRALRERAGIKVRQPLRAMHVRSSDARALELLSGRFASQQVLDELNVKAWGSLGADDGSTCRLTGKANFRALGPRLGARMKAAAAAIAALDQPSLARLRRGGSVSLAVDGIETELGPGDVQVNVQSTGGLDVETDGTLVAWIDTALDEALVAEGLARELVSRVNALRKERGLAVEDRIRLSLEPGDAGTAACLERHAEFIARETLAASIDIAARDLMSCAATPARWELAPGRVVVCAMERAPAL